MVESLSDTLRGLANSDTHGSAELWLILYIASRGGKVKWREVVNVYAEVRGWTREAARVKLQRAYSKLKKLGLVHKRREVVFLSKPRVTYLSLTPRARAILLSGCR